MAGALAAETASATSLRKDAERRGFEPRTSQRCVREYLAFAKKFEAKAPVWKTSAGKLEEAVAAFSAALDELTQAAAATIVARRKPAIDP
jgi:hypothetical protein